MNVNLTLFGQLIVGLVVGLPIMVAACGYYVYKKSRQSYGESIGPVEPKKSVESRLQELAALRDKGFVSAEEFEVLRKQLLSEV